MLHFITLLVCFFPFSAPVFAAVERWNLDRFVARAFEHSPEIKALAQDVVRAEHLARQAGVWDNPEGSVSFGPMRQADVIGTSLDITLKQNIPLFGQKAMAERLGEQGKVTAEFEQIKQLLKIKHTVVRLVYQLAAVEEQTQHTEHRREKMSLIARYIESRPFVSPNQAVEKSLLLNRLREVEGKFLEISQTKEKIWSELNTFLGLDFSISPAVRWQTKAALPDRSKLWALCQEQNPELKQQKSLISTASIEVDLASKKAFPEIRLGGGFNQQTADLPQRVYVATIEFSLPFLDRGRNAKLAALAEKEAAVNRLEQKQRELQASFDQNWSSLMHSKSKIELYPLSLVHSLEEQMGRAEQNWKKGLVQVTAFLELENQVHEQVTKVFEAQNAYIEALSQVQLLAGSDFRIEEK